MASSREFSIARLHDGSEFDASNYDIEQIHAGWDVLLDYLNNGTSFEALLDIQTRARHWCRGYYDGVGYRCYTPQAVIAEHPRLFDLGIPSWLRLEDLHGWDHLSFFTSQEEQHEDSSNSENDCFSFQFDLEEQALTTQHNRSFSLLSNNDNDMRRCHDGQSPEETMDPFPRYSEPCLVPDEDLYVILAYYDLMKDDKRIENPDQDDYRDYRTPFTAADLWGSPIMYHYPEVICNLAFMSLEVLCEMEVDFDYGEIVPELVWARIVDNASENFSLHPSDGRFIVKT